jgi:histidinol-phosphate aminotransferase
VLDTQAQLLREQREKLAQALAAMRGITVFHSSANFLLFRMAGANNVFEGLKSRKVLVKYLGQAHPLLQDCLRVTVSTPEENALFLNALSSCTQSPATSL